jgi:hypothetical protein
MGAASGAHIETTTKSGTNAFHGQVYEYFQNNIFDAQPTFLEPNPFFTGTPPLHRNVFGVTLGGPIKRDKLFFFASYQLRRQRAQHFQGTVPDAFRFFGVQKLQVRRAV